MRQKIITRLRIGKAKVAINLGDERLSVSYGAYLDNRLYVGKKLSEEDIKNLQKRTDIDLNYNFAVKEITLKSTSIKSLKSKLKKKKVGDKDIDYIFELLSKDGLMNDEKSFKEMYQKLESKGYGERRIKEVLFDKGFSEESIDSVTFDHFKELERAKTLLPSLVKRYSSHNNFQLRVKVANSLMRKGFSLSIAYEALNYIDKVSEEDEYNKLLIDFKAIKNKLKKNHNDKDLDKRVIKYLLSKGYPFSLIERIKEYEVD